MTAGEAGQLLQVSAERVRQLERAGLLHAFRTARGYRIFLLEDVERLAAARSAARARGHEGAGR
ncbi:MAG: MerR family DNA-binding transcriptional regulator [Candidatus Rokubacteria bacterium]|nr:MerR family DNA-binding transcriptional regulator [Candidatus Rokubacteria bacterium]